MCPTQQFRHAGSCITFERLVALDLTLTWAKGCGHGSTDDAEVWHHGNTQILFPQLTNLTIPICVRTALQGFKLPSALSGFFVDDLLQFPRLESVLVFDESKKNNIDPITPSCWAVVSSFVHRHWQCLKVLLLPPSWASQHVKYSWKALDRINSESHDTDLALTLLHSLSVNQAGLYGLMYRLQPGYPMPCALRSLEVTKTSDPCDSSVGCICALPDLPNLEVLRLCMSGRERLSYWMLSYPTVRRLFLDVPPEVRACGRAKVTS
jgi:hypothetical protein